MKIFKLKGKLVSAEQWEGIITPALVSVVTTGPSFSGYFLVDKWGNKIKLQLRDWVISDNGYYICSEMMFALFFEEAKI